MDEIIKAGALTLLSGRDAHPPRVSDEVLDHADAIEVFCRAWANPANRLWLGACAAIGWRPAIPPPVSPVSPN